MPLGDAVVVLARTGGKGTFSSWTALARCAAHCTALGKIMLAALPPDQLEQFLLRSDLKAHTPKSITSVEMLRREIAEVRRTGLAIDDGEFDAELRCVALPVRDFSSRVIGRHRGFGPGMAAVDRSASKRRGWCVRPLTAVSRFGFPVNASIRAADDECAGVPCLGMEVTFPQLVAGRRRWSLSGDRRRAHRR